MLQSNRLPQYAASPVAYRADLAIDVGGAPAKLGYILDPWQRDDFAALDPGWQRAVGHPNGSGPSRAYLERPRGHSKTSDIATMITWAMVFAPKPITLAAAAGDKDQARLIRDAVARLVRLNPLLGRTLDVQAYRVVNTRTDSTLEILSADAPTSYGLILDAIVIDEITNWPASGQALWDSLISASAKRGRCLLTVIANAGVGQGESWQWRIREACRTSPDWHFHSLDGSCASWISEKHLAEQRLLLPKIAFDRLWLNRWSTLSGDALLPEDIASVFSGDLSQLAAKEKDFTYAAGVDLSTTRDHSAFCIVGRHRQTNVYRVARCYLWRPLAGNKINLEQIENTILDANHAFHLRAVAADPFQASYLVQRLQRRGVRISECPQTGKQLVAQAQLLIELVNSGSLKSYHHAPLRYDMEHLQVETRSYGMRLTSTRNEHGHGDCASALSIALVAAREARGRQLLVAGGSDRDPIDEPPQPAWTQRRPYFLRQ